MTLRVDVYSRHDAFVGTIAPGDLIAFEHSDELNGEDSVAISTMFRLREGYRLVWRDRLGAYHEHVCQDPKGTHGAGGVVYSDTALNSICELFGDYIEDKRPYGYSFARALAVALEPTRWQAGTVDVQGAVSSSLTFYHTSAREALQAILDCGGELETVIRTDSRGVSARIVNIRQHRGDTNGHRRFAYGKDATSVAKTEHWGAITACYGYGKGEETDAGGYGRKLTFGAINGGLNYVQDGEALESFGRPDGNGGIAHVFGVYENDKCEDAQQLKSETEDYLEAHKVPGVTYEADVLDLVAFGRDWEGVSVGDDVQLIDAEFDPELRCEGRVTKLVTDMLGGSQKVTLGNVTETMADMWAQQMGELKDLYDRSSNWDVAASTPGAYLQQIIDGLNEHFNLNGMSYMHVSFEKGIILSSVPLDESGRPTVAGGIGMQLCSQGFRIANKTGSDGEYDWETFGTGDGFVATMIVAGILNASLLKTGRILVGDEENPVFMADIDSGEVVISSGASLGEGSVGDAVTSSSVEFGLSGDVLEEPDEWSEDTTWKHGKVLWQRTRLVHADGSVTYGSASVVQTAEGTGVASQTDQYYLSTSDEAPEGGSWSDVQQVWITGRHYWMRRKVTWTDGTVTYGEPYLAKALTNANQSVDDLDESLDAEGTFNRLTDNGHLQGLYMTGGNLYMNASFIKSGTLDANLIRAGVIQDVAGKNKWDLVSGNMALSGNITMSGGRIQGANGSYWDLDTGEMDLSFTPAGMLTQEDLDAAISDVEVDMGGLSSRITTAQTTANSARSAASTAQSTANTAKSTADSANTKATSAKAKTDRISFTSSGIQVTGTDGVRRTAMTYGSDGIVHAGSVLDIETDNATFGIKDWGIAYQGPGGENSTVQFYVSNNKDEIFARTSNTSIAIRSDGAYVNGRKLAWA